MGLQSSARGLISKLCLYLKNYTIIQAVYQYTTYCYFSMCDPRTSRTSWCDPFPEKDWRPMIYISVSRTFFKWGPLSLVRMFYGPPYSWDYQTHYACPKQCSEHVFATENPSFVAESRVGRAVSFIKCQSWERKFKDACCM